MIASIWSLPAWQVLLLGACLCGAMIVQERLYPLPEVDDPANRGCLWWMHLGLGFSRWVAILIGGCTIALGLIRLFVGA